MRKCSFERLLDLLDKRLDLDGQIDVLNHIERCDICREALISIAGDRNSYIFRQPRRGAAANLGSSAVA